MCTSTDEISQVAPRYIDKTFMGLREISSNKWSKVIPQNDPTTMGSPPYSTSVQEIKIIFET